MKNVREFLEMKRDALTEVARRKLRHKTEEEKNRYYGRYEKAKDYLGELAIVYAILEQEGFLARTASEKYVEVVHKSHGTEKLFEGDYIKLYKRCDNGEKILITTPVTNIALFK